MRFRVKIGTSYEEVRQIDARSEDRLLEKIRRDEQGKILSKRRDGEAHVYEIVPVSAIRLVDVEIIRAQEHDPDSSYLEQDGYEYRLAAYKRGEFHFLGVWAEATVRIDKEDAKETVRSGGIWGVESDSTEGYLRDLEASELLALYDELHQMGVDGIGLPKEFLREWKR